MARKNYTAAHRSAILKALREREEKYDRALSRHLAAGDKFPIELHFTFEEFAREHGISVATLYRWRILSKPSAKFLTESKDRIDRSDVNISILDLANDNTDVWRRIVAILNMSAWMIFPHSKASRCMRTLSLVGAYLGKDYEARNLAEFPPSAQIAIQRFVTGDLLKRLSNDQSTSGEHTYFSYFDTPFTDRDILIAIGRKFLEASHKGKQVTVSTLRHLISEGRLLPSIELEATAFRTIWRDLSNSIPFHCAEADLDLRINLNVNESVRSDVNDLLTGPVGIRTFMSLAADYERRIQMALDPRARPYWRPIMQKIE